MNTCMAFMGLYKVKNSRWAPRGIGRRAKVLCDSNKG